MWHLWHDAFSFSFKWFIVIAFSYVYFCAGSLWVIIDLSEVHVSWYSLWGKKKKKRERERENLLGEEKAGVGGGWINTYASKKKKKILPNNTVIALLNPFGFLLWLLV